MIGYAKCPICDGTGEHTTKASDFERSRINNANNISINNWAMSVGPLSDTPNMIDVPEPEYQTCTKCKGEMVLPLYEGVEDD